MQCIGPKKVIITLKNDVMNKQRCRNGTYILQVNAKVNGKEFWIQDDKDSAIWFDEKNKNWKIGCFQDIGRNIRSFESKNNASELHKVTSWDYFDHEVWKSAPTNDMQVRGMFDIIFLLDFYCIIYNIFPQKRSDS